VQINERLDGILAGMKVRLQTQQYRRDRLILELDQAKRVDIQLSIQRRPYFQAKRDLESLQTMVDRLKLRLLQERLDAALPPKP